MSPNRMVPQVRRSRITELIHCSAIVSEMLLDTHCVSPEVLCWSDEDMEAGQLGVGGPQRRAGRAPWDGEQYFHGGDDESWTLYS